MNEREQFLDRVPQGSAQANQKRPFGRSGLDVSRPGPEDCVLGLQLYNFAEQD